METVTKATDQVLEGLNPLQQRKNRSIRLWYWITTSLLAFILLSGGWWLMNNGQSANAHLGYPAYFWQILGVFKILGGIAVLIPRFPRLKEWAYAGAVFNMLGASATHAFVSDSAGQIVTPLVICGIALASWYLRPASRKMEVLG